MSRRTRVAACVLAAVVALDVTAAAVVWSPAAFGSEPPAVPCAGVQYVPGGTCWVGSIEGGDR